MSIVRPEELLEELDGDIHQFRAKLWRGVQRELVHLRLLTVAHGTIIRRVLLHSQQAVILPH